MNGSMVQCDNCRAVVKVKNLRGMEHPEAPGWYRVQKMGESAGQEPDKEWDFCSELCLARTLVGPMIE